MSAEAGIAAFWAWWSDGGAERTQEFVAGEVEHDLAAEIAPLVAAIHPGLQWELALGERSRHTFVVTAAGDPALRATARAWLRAAPAPTVLWGYDALRRPRLDVADSVFEFAGHRVAMGDFVVAAHLRDTSIDVGVHHPVFLDVGDNEAAQLTYLALDGFLGEEAVETWLGEVTWPAERPLDGFPLQHLPGVVADFAARFRGADGEPQWLALSGVGPTGSPISALAQVPLRQITYPLFDTHIGLSVPYAQSTPEGLPGREALADLRDVEERIRVALGADGRVVAHQSHEGVRLIHAYADAGSAAADRVTALVAGWDQAELTVSHDPGWSLVHHLCG